MKQTCEFPIDLSKIQFPPELEENEESDVKQQKRGALFSVSIKSSGASGAGNFQTKLHLLGVGTGSNYDIKNQVTSCSLTEISDKDSSYELRVLQQAISVTPFIVLSNLIQHNGAPFVVYDIFGLENAVKDQDCCVICMSEDRNTV